MGIVRCLAVLLLAVPAAAQDVDVWIKRLAHDEYPVAAVDALQKIGPRAVAAVLDAAFAREDPELPWHRAQLALMRLGRKYPEVFPALLRATPPPAATAESRARRVRRRWYALDIYCALRLEPATYRGVLVPWLKEATPGRRDRLLLGLCNSAVYFPEMIPHLLDGLKREGARPRPRVKGIFALALGAFVTHYLPPDAERIVPHLIEAARDKSERVRDGAVHGLGRLAEVSDQARKYVLAHTQKPVTRGEIWARSLIDNVDVTPVLNGFSAGQTDTVFQALHQRWIERAVPFGPERAHVFKHANERLLMLACKVAARSDRNAQPDVIRLLRHPSECVVLAALAALERIGDKSPELRKALAEVQEHSKRRIRREAAHTMVRMGIEVDRMVAWFASYLPKTPRVDPYVPLHDFTRLGPIAKSVAPELRTYLDNDYRFEAERALWSVTGETKDAIATLRKHLMEEVSEEACLLAGEIGPAAKPLIPLIVRGLSGEDAHHAAIALGRIGDAAAVPALQACMARKDKLVRAAAAGALYQLGAQDPQATMILRGIAMDMTGIDRHWWPHHCAAIRVAHEHGERIDGDLDLLIAGVGKDAGIEFLHALGELGERGDPKAAGALWEVAHSYRPHYLRAAALEARRALR